MASVTFTRCWLNNLDDLDDGRGFRMAVPTAQPQVQARVDQFGQSRLRAVGTGVTAQQVALLLRCSGDDIPWLLTHAGLPGVMVRLPIADRTYSRFAAIYTDLAVPEQYSPLVTVSATLTVNEISYSDLKA